MSVENIYIEVENYNCIDSVPEKNHIDLTGVVEYFSFWYLTFDLAVTIDLVDMEGQVTNLSGRSKDYAHELVTARGIYILIRVERKYDV